ncbi:hypothetical protein ABFS83_05G080900 [Erythranthe nasuta]
MIVALGVSNLDESDYNDDDEFEHNSRDELEHNSGEKDSASSTRAKESNSTLNWKGNNGDTDDESLQLIQRFTSLTFVDTNEAGYGFALEGAAIRRELMKMIDCMVID